ncbi:protein of unknown function [Denitratisoma oestradiolicum]|uniref:Uncharacterized protein n=1 Tax=Denitratisoma oestradiolicum TaxID=311182 RepID=A0A6S6XZ14_9PROT|nr:protein of unknown function [Denitratisoma oestradiolicum]
MVADTTPEESMRKGKLNAPHPHPRPRAGLLIGSLRSKFFSRFVMAYPISAYLVRISLP